MAESGTRVRKLTPKAEAAFQEKKETFHRKEETLSFKLNTLLDKVFSEESLSPLSAKTFKEEVKIIYQKFKSLNIEFCEFIATVDSDENQVTLDLLNNNRIILSDKTHKCIDQLNDIIGVSLASSRTSEKRAVAEVARVKLIYAKKEAALKKQLANALNMKAEMEANLEIVRQEKETAAAYAEADFQEELDHQSVNLNLPVQDNIEMTRNFVNHGMRENVEHSANRTCDYINAETLATFLLRKDLIPHRLTVFNGKPESFAVWCSTFKNVMGEIKATPVEEIDLLVNNLQGEAKTWAESLRASNIFVPERGLSLIWERLQMAYGSPEKVAFSLKERIDKFPKINYQNIKSMYDLMDLLMEVQSVKQNPIYASQLSLYDSSFGVNQVVTKLPYDLQQNWINRASRFKIEHGVIYPPFFEFVNFVKDMARIKNDPAFYFHPQNTSGYRTNKQSNNSVLNRMTEVVDENNNGKYISSSNRCPIHNARHALVECRVFNAKTLNERRTFLKEKGICFKCLSSNQHKAFDCTAQVSCDKCSRKNHLTIMHHDLNPRYRPPKVSNPVIDYGGENQASETVSSKCTTLCDQKFKGQSCGKIVQVLVKHNGLAMRVYAVLDDQSNRSLITPELCDKLGITGESYQYKLTSCAGTTVMKGRRIHGLSIGKLDNSNSYQLPTLIECEQIPQELSEIPTPEIANNFAHLRQVASFIPPLDDSLGIQLLIGRDLPSVHHVLRQVIGPNELPFAVELPLGWVIIGEVCLGRVHKPETVNTYFTSVDKFGRNSLFTSCHCNLDLKESPCVSDVFIRTKHDNKTGQSIEDREFLNIMDREFHMDPSGQWSSPLPFKSSQTDLWNNKEQAVQRFKASDRSLRKNPTKLQHLVTFMDKIFSSGAAEKAPEVESGKPCTGEWYLPLFGIYNPKKPDQVRGVFDSAVRYGGRSLNDMLLSGPNLTNNLLGVLIRFRRDQYAISADIEQMFYRFLVNIEHRDWLRFLWYENNDPSQPEAIYRMRVHVFGNKPSPAVATYGLHRAVQDADDDVKQFVKRDFYVDDALTSLPTKDKAISLLQRTQLELAQNGKIRLHKIASNSPEIMKHFPKDDLGSNLKDLELNSELPLQQSLGMTWDLEQDKFVFVSPLINRSFTRRGFLSELNSVFDPVGFLAPFHISGKILLREACPKGTAWDDSLPENYKDLWCSWKNCLEQLNGYCVPRMLINTSLSDERNVSVYIYTDASESAIAAAAYIVAKSHGQLKIGFIMGKTKLAPKSGHSVPRLELCAAVLGIEVATFVSEQLSIPLCSFKFFTDSKVVLGYVNNRTRRFYTYVANRVACIHENSSPEQWSYVTSELNPADAATRSCFTNMNDSLRKWYIGPTYLSEEKPVLQEEFCLQDPNNDSELRPDTGVSVTVTKVCDFKTFPVLDASEKFSTWNSFISAIALLKHIAGTYSKMNGTQCSGWHICEVGHSPVIRQNVERFILSELQKKYYSDEILALSSQSEFPKNSSILKLSPYLDDSGILRVGGRLRKLQESVGIASIKPVIVPKSYVAKLLVKFYHQKTSHQGRLFTEGILRSNGFWIIGAKRIVSSFIHQCVTCKKLRGTLLHQKMADLPIDRLNPGPPFSAVGVDIFGPWNIMTRKTRGGAANSKRWAVMFTCLTSRAAHIEIIEEMTSSSFINALRRFIAIRGPVRIIRSDRGTNFVGAADSISANVINVEDHNFSNKLLEHGINWYFNAPHASHMGGVWERVIGVARRILDGMLLNSKNLTHEVLCTLMAEVTAIMNSRPIVPVDTDSDDPLILSPNLLLTQKQGELPNISTSVDLKEAYKSQWKRVQVLSDMFWSKWRGTFLSQLQSRRKWQVEIPNLKKGDVVLLRDKTLYRNDWPMAVVEETIRSDDKLVRKAVVRCIKDGKTVYYTRPICELVLLISN